MRIIQSVLLTHTRFYWKVKRRLRRWYLSCVLDRIGENCSFADGVIITDPEYTSIGSRVIINEGVILLTFNPEATITIGDDVTISYGVNIITGGLDISDGVDHRKHTTKSVVIEDNVWIGAKSIVLSGITVGKGSVIGAGSVVTRDVPPHTLVCGVPARSVRQLTEKQDF
ncbi:MAG: acyltransferase [Bacteroidia bacterium]|nr:acyltransferase [Bacteroidia bacterium]